MAPKKTVLAAGIAALALGALAAGLFWAALPREEAAVSTPAPSPTEAPAETPFQGVIVEWPEFIATEHTPLLIAEVLEAADERTVVQGEEYAQLRCRLVYGYQLGECGLQAAEGEKFTLSLTALALERLGGAEMLLCGPIEGLYRADFAVPIVDGRMALEGEWPDLSVYHMMNRQVQYLAEERARGAELSETAKLAPASPLESGMTVEELTAFFRAWESYVEQVDADLRAYEREQAAEGVAVY